MVGLLMEKKFEENALKQSISDKAIEIAEIDHFLFQVLDPANTAFSRFQKNYYEGLSYLNEINQLESYVKSIIEKINDFSKKLNFKKELTLLEQCSKLLDTLRKKQLENTNIFSQVYLDACASDLVHLFKKCKNAIEASFYQYRSSLDDSKIPPLPPEVWVPIFKKLNLTDLRSIARTSKDNLEMTTDSSLWEDHINERLLTEDEIKKIKKIHPNLNFKQVVRRVEQFNIKEFKTILSRVLEQKANLNVNAYNSKIDQQISDNNRQIPDVFNKFDINEFKKGAKQILKKYISEDRANQKSKLKGFYRLKQIFSFLFKDYRHKIDLKAVSEEDKKDINYFNKGETEKRRAELYFQLLDDIDKVTNIDKARQFNKCLESAFRKCIQDESTNLTKRINECYSFTTSEIQKIDAAVENVKNTSNQIAAQKLRIESELRTIPVQVTVRIKIVLDIINEQYQLYKNNWGQNNRNLVKICNRLTEKENALHEVNSKITEAKKQIEDIDNHNYNERRKYNEAYAKYENDKDCWESYNFHGPEPSPPPDPDYLSDKVIHQQIGALRKVIVGLEASKSEKEKELNQFKDKLKKNKVELRDLAQLKPNLDAATQLKILRMHDKAQYYKTMALIKNKFPNEFEIYLTELSSEHPLEKNQGHRP